MRSAKMFLVAAILCALSWGMGLSAGAQNVSDLKRGTSVSYSLGKKLSHNALHGKFKNALAKERARAVGAGDTATENKMAVWEDLRRALEKSGVFPLIIPVVTEYATPDPADPNVSIKVSGVVLLPVDIADYSNPRSVPIFCFQHPTQFERKYSPSKCASWVTMWDDPMYNVILGTLIAACGYVVVIPDYPGMGIDTTHPQNYCTASLGDCVVDLANVAVDWTADKSVFRKLIKGLVKWNGKVYLMGYSEGGYVTAVAAKKMRADYPAKYDVRGVAPLDAPHSLSVAMRDVMLNSGPSYSAPCFLPYVVQGFDYIYGATHPESRYSAAIKKTVTGYSGDFAADLKKMLDGSKSSDQIDAFIKQVTPYTGPSCILTDTYRADLANDDSDLIAVLRQNDSFYDWAPDMPFMMFHHMRDDLVPYENSSIALKAFVDAGAKYAGLMPYDANLATTGSIHGAAAPVAYVLGFAWIHCLSGADDPDRLLWPKVKK